MKDKKNIDQLFKERFEHFEAAPSPHVWENIQAQLQEKKKDRKVIPLWWKVAGVAALLALMFTIGSSVYETNNTTIVDGDSEKIEPILDKSNHSPLIDTDKQIIENKNELEIANEGVKSKIESNTTTSEIVTAEKTVGTQKNSVTEKDTYKIAGAENSSLSEGTSTQSQKTATQKNDKILKNNTVNNSIAEKQDAVANATTTIKDNTNISKTDVLKNTSIIDTGVAVNSVSEKTTEINTSNNEKSNAIIKKDEEINSSGVVVAQEIISEEKKTDLVENKQSIFDAIDEQNKVKAEDVIAKTDPPKNRWEVAPNFAPVYYNTLTEGSSIDASFADNAQSGDVNFSYGVGVSYAVNDRLSIRSGVSNVDLSYSTGGLELGNGPIDVALRSVTYDRSQGVLIPQDKGTIAAQNPEGGFGDITLKSTNGEAFLNQNISYYEVPLELKYALFNKKIGVNIIGGMSTLFLGNNEVSVTAGDFNETLGAANNLSNVSFSTNVGLGFDYKLSSKFKFNVEPMFKYQLNPYTDTSVDFRPYYLGVYTGLSFKF